MAFGKSTDPPARYFTPDEANGLLPRVRGLMSRATENARRIRERMQSLESLRAEERERLGQELDALRESVAHALEQVRDLGVQVKGLDSGLVDFPALRNGEPVLLCWRVGEARVEWWHPLQGGFAARQRITGEHGVRWEWRN
jgi:hypothetical protein